MKARITAIFCAVAASCAAPDPVVTILLDRAHCVGAESGAYRIDMEQIAQFRGSQLLAAPATENASLMVAISQAAPATSPFRLVLEGYETRRSSLQISIGRRDSGPSATSIEPAPEEKPTTPCIVIGIVAPGLQTLEVSGPGGLFETLALE